MITTGEFVLNLLLNSLWQIPAIFIVALLGAFTLQKCPARYRHIVWILTLALCLIVPVASAGGLRPVFLSRAEVTPTLSSPTIGVSADDDGTTPLERSHQRSRQIPIDSSSKLIQLALAGYALFLLLCGVRLVRQWARKMRLEASVTGVGLPDRVETTAMYCQTLFQLRRVHVVSSEFAPIPCTSGVRRPLIILPESFCQNGTDETLLSVIAHEMAHVQRGDFLTKFICELISLPISFHPITYFIKQQIERERELSCDELVTARAVLPDRYARSLLAAADLAILPVPQTSALSVFDGFALEKRIRRLIQKQKLWGRSASRTITVVAIAAVCVSTLAISAFAIEFRAKLDMVASDIAPANRQAPANETKNPETMRAQPQTRNHLQSNSLQESNSPQERAQAACTAGRKRDVEAIPMLVAMLIDDTKIEAFPCWDSGRWTPALDTFKHPSPGEQAALALASMGRDAFPVLVDQLDNSNATARRNAAWAVGELTNMIPGERSGATTKLVFLLNDGDVWVRMAAARALGELRDLRATESLSAMLLDPDWRARQMAAWALSELKDERAVKALGNALVSDARAEVRRDAAAALGEIRSADGLPYLRQAINDPESSVSAKARWAISEIDDTDGLF